MAKGGYVYVLASQRNGTLYVGVTYNLVRRIDEHKQHVEKDNPSWNDLVEELSH